jgi:hypothetical protein
VNSIDITNTVGKLKVFLLYRSFTKTMNNNKIVVCVLIMMVILATSCNGRAFSGDSKANKVPDKRENLLVKAFQRTSGKDDCTPTGGFCESRDHCCIGDICLYAVCT